MEDKSLIESIEMPDEDLMKLADNIVALIEESKQQLAISINRTIKTNIGMLDDILLNLNNKVMQEQSMVRIYFLVLQKFFVQKLDVVTAVQILII